jgi:hypothetical protein
MIDNGAELVQTAERALRRRSAGGAPPWGSMRPCTTSVTIAIAASGSTPADS